MSESKFKTLRHVETVRNYLNTCIKNILDRQEKINELNINTLDIDELKHIEATHKYFNKCIRDITDRQERHDQSKLEKLEVETFEVYTPKLKSATYLSPEYNQFLKEMKPALDNHYKVNKSHHPEGNERGIRGMDLLDLVEMIVDWKASGLRMKDGDIFKSIEMNQKRFGYSDELKDIFNNTAKFLNSQNTFHKANES